jgi:hypothetical protein
VPRQIYNLTFHADMFGQPILSRLAQRFRLKLTIRRAILNEEGGWAEVELDGTEEEIGRAMADLQTTGVNTTGPITDRVEPDPAYVSPAIGRGT